MSKYIILTLLFTTLLLSGCGNRLQNIKATPTETPVSLEYPSSHGYLKVTLTAPAGSIELPLERYAMEYTVSNHDEELLWKVRTRGLIFGIQSEKETKDQQPTSKNLFLNLARKRSHPDFIFHARTDKLGNFIALDTITEAESGAANTNPFWHRHYQKVFQMLFVPFATKQVLSGAVVSRGKSMIPRTSEQYYSPPEILFEGMASYDGVRCLKLQYETKSNVYKDVSRVKRQESITTTMLLDENTKILRKAQSFTRIGEVLLILKAEYGDTPFVLKEYQ